MNGQEFLWLIFSFYETYHLGRNSLECSNDGDGEFGAGCEGPDLESEPVIRIANFKAARSMRLKFSSIAGDNSKASFLTKAETADLNSVHSGNESDK